MANTEEQEFGARWYRDARAYAEELSQEFSLNVEASAAVIAVMSPGTEWGLNKRDARRLIADTLAGDFQARYATYGQNVIKARCIVELERQGDAWGEYVRGPKVTAFWRNIVEPRGALGNVTVDFHAYSVAHGKRYTTKSVPAFGRLGYERIALAYRQVAKSVGLLPHELQAVCWVCWKRLAKQGRRVAA